jgi:hypothetical protein
MAGTGGGPAIPESSSERSRPEKSRSERFRSGKSRPEIPRSEGSRPDRSSSDNYDFERLELAVAQLAAACRQQHAENSSLRRELEHRGQRIRALDSKLLEANQKRLDVVKRIDELIAQIEQYEASSQSVDA